MQFIENTDKYYKYISYILKGEGRYRQNIVLFFV